MAITNGYATLADAKEWVGINDAQDDLLLERAIESASRSIDRFCGRKFFLDSAATARRFHRSSLTTLSTPDIGSSASMVLKTDENDDGVFETTHTSYQLEPYLITDRPATLVRLLDDVFPLHSSGRFAIELTARWGFPSTPIEVEQATLILATRIFKRKNSPEGVLSFAESGIIRVSVTDRDVTQLISPYRKVSVL